jgi:hypothetical protein
MTSITARTGSLVRAVSLFTPPIRHPTRASRPAPLRCDARRILTSTEEISS